MTDTVIRNSPLKAEDMALAMNIKFDSLGAQAGIDAGNAWLERNKLAYFPLAEANAVMATMYLHLNDIVGFANFRSAMMECEDGTETIQLNLKRNYANWLYRKGQFVEAEILMADERFKSPERPLEERMADRLIRHVGRLLGGDMKAVGMLERLFHKAYEAELPNATYLRNICLWAVVSLYATGRNKDANALAQLLVATGDKADKLMGPEPSATRVARVKLLMRLRFMPLQWAAARYAIAKYRLK